MANSYINPFGLEVWIKPGQFIVRTECDGIELERVVYTQSQADNLTLADMF